VTIAISKNGKFLASKIFAKKLAIFLESSVFWQYLPNLAPYGNPAEKRSVRRLSAAPASL